MKLKRHVNKEKPSELEDNLQQTAVGVSSPTREKSFKSPFPTCHAMYDIQNTLLLTDEIYRSPFCTSTNMSGALVHLAV
jgi:hypothetical protein